MPNLQKPKNINEAVDKIISMLKYKNFDFNKNEEDAALALHHSLGRWIRNNFELWGESELKTELKGKNIDHPDDMSHHLIVKAIKKGRGNV